MSYYFIDRRGSLPLITLGLNVEKFNFPVRNAAPEEQYFPTHLHNHDIVEILCVQEGRMDVTIRDEHHILKKGECAVCSPYDLHEICARWSDGPLTYLCLTLNLTKLFQFPNSILWEQIQALLREDLKFSAYYGTGADDTENLAKLCQNLYDSFSLKTPTEECRTLSELYAVFQLLFAKHIRQSDTVLDKKRDNEFMRKITLYLQENYKKDISTADAANALFMPSSHFCRIFRRHYDMSFTNYLCRYRIQIAAQQYMGSALPITVIAGEVGFSNYNYFSHSFRKYMGVSPAVYFGKWKKKAEDGHLK